MSYYSTLQLLAAVLLYIMLMFTYVVVTVVVAVVADEVLVNTEEMAALACELRAKIYSKIRSWAREDQPTFDEERLVSPAMHTYT